MKILWLNSLSHFWGSLQKLAGKEAVEWQNRDRYGRLSGKIRLDKRNILPLEQIQARLENEQNEADQILYAKPIQYARTQRLGLWREAIQIPPWAEGLNILDDGYRPKLTSLQSNGRSAVHILTVADPSRWQRQVCPSIRAP